MKNRSKHEHRFLSWLIVTMRMKKPTYRYQTCTIKRMSTGAEYRIGRSL